MFRSRHATQNLKGKHWCIATLALSWIVHPTNAQTIDVLALDTSNADPNWVFDTPILDALAGITYTEVSPTAFADVDLSSFDVLYVASTFQTNHPSDVSWEALDALYARASDIAEFVASGHGIVALCEPYEGYGWLPEPVVPSSRGDVNSVYIQDPTHPIMAGLTNAGLDGWGLSSHNYFVDVGSYSVLASQDANGDRPITLAASYGSGRVFVTSQDPEAHYWWNPLHGVALEQEVDFLQNAFDWTAIPSSVPPDPVSLIELLIAYVESLNLQHGIENGLDAKLDAALQAIEDLNNNNDVAAINTLEAFINAVQAQAGNQIPNDEAGTLNDDAQYIIDLLSG